KYIPIVALFVLIQMVLGGYLAHIYADPTDHFIISQDILPFNVTRALHTNIAIIWVAIGWQVGGLVIAPIVAGKDVRFARLV
ncbi:nitric oxide reductase, partial [Aliarcobacter butzleri]